MSPIASLPSAVEGPPGTVKWSEVVNSVQENGPQHQRAACLSPAVEAEALTRHSSAVFNPCYPPDEKGIWGNPSCPSQATKTYWEGAEFCLTPITLA